MDINFPYPSFLRRVLMEMLFWVFGFLALNMLLHVHAQPGFISIDCGVDEDYVDDTTQIFYSSDSKYIDSGENKNHPYDLTYPFFEKQLTTVRSFPNGIKNCYTLPADQGKDNQYLIRALFLRGDVQEYEDRLPEFKLYLGVEEWDSVKFDGSHDIVRKEIIYVPTTAEIYVCLVNTNLGTPFISTLELRPIDNSIYNKTQSGSLVLFNRYNFGSETNETVRYGNDTLDRMWVPYNWINWEAIKAPYSSSVLSETEYKLPAKVMETAVKPVNRTSLDFYLIGIDSSQEFYMYFHFAEVEEVQDQIRQFTILLNNKTILGPLVPTYMVSKTYSTQSSLSGSHMNFSLNQTSQSTLPPIMNALEIYMIKEFLQSPTEQRDVDAMKKIKSVYQVAKISWQGDPCLPRNYSWDGLICSTDNGYAAPSITSLNLSSSNLVGKIDRSFSNLTSLQYLDLSYNSLYGEVPEFLAEMSSLKTLNLSGNKFTGSVPSALLAKSNDGTLSLSLDGNPDLCKANSCETKKKNSVAVPVVASIASFVVLLGAIFAVYRCCIGGGICGKHAGVEPNDQDSESHLELQEPDVPNEEENLKSEFEEIQKEVMIEIYGKLEAKKQRLSYSEVKRITNNFGKVIGQGGSGLVYCGHLSNGIKVAVKKLSPSLHLAFKQFQNEAQLLSTIHHRNLVSLMGYCDEGSNMLLIYEYMANGNLREHISGKFGSVLSWEQRLQLAIEAAQALEYLHNGCSPTIIHRDVKAANILLNEKMQAKVADFGWSRSMPSENPSHVSTTFVVGTFGYLDPEYMSTGKLTKESDVYSFGIVLLELISGLPAQMEDGRSILDWVRPNLERGEIEKIVDPRLEGMFNACSAWRAIETAMSCVPFSPTERQTMSSVVSELRECLKLVEMSSTSSFEITITQPIGAATGPGAR